MKQAAAGAASATQAVKADKKPFFSQRTLSHFIDFLFVLPALILLLPHREAGADQFYRLEPAE